MTITPPANATYVRLRYRLLDVTADSADADELPDWAALPEGAQVTVSWPTNTIVDTADPPTTFYPQPVTCTLDADGILLGPNGSELWVLDPNNTALQPHGYTLAVRVTVPGRTPRSFNALLSNANDDGSYDLTLNSPVPGSPGNSITKGDKGDPGPPLSISGTKADGATIQATAGASAGEAWIAADTGHVWSWDGTAWQDVGQFQGPKGDTGDPGPTNSLSIGTVTQGSAAATITGSAPSQTLNLTLPKGDTGPANSLSIGTVTQGAAAATITGTAPAQTLNLWLPKGDTGTPGADGAVSISGITGMVAGDALVYDGTSWGPGRREIRGHGMPNGVQTAPVGTEYFDLDGTCGAWRWLKTSGTGNTGWVVTYGDTGWRDITNAAYLSAGVAKIRRVGRAVAVRFINVVNVATGGHPQVIDVSGGFQSNLADAASWGCSPVGYMGSNATGTKPFAFAGYSNVRLHSIGGYYATDGAKSGGAQWTTDNDWPSTLPGTPA